MLATQIPWGSCIGRVYNNTLFVFGDAIYDFDKKFSLNDIKNIDDNQFEEKTTLNYEINGKKYIFSTKDLSLTSYPREDDIDLKNYIVRSKDYGFVYIKDNSVYWEKADKTKIKICSYEKMYDEAMDFIGFTRYGFNSKGDYVYIISSYNSYTVVDLKEGTFKNYAMPGKFTGIKFGPDDKEVSIFYTFDKMAQQVWLEDLTYFDNKGKKVSLSSDAYNIQYFKNFIIFESGIQAMGMNDIWSNQVNVYNITTGEKTVIIGGICSYYIENDNIFASIGGTKSGIYKFNSKTKKFVSQAKVKKYLGYGIYMVKTGQNEVFQDKNGKDIAYFAGVRGQNWTCAIIPGSKIGFLYNGISLKTINLPDATRLSKADQIKIIDGQYISYKYSVTSKGKIVTYIRILKI